MMNITYSLTKRFKHLCTLFIKILKYILAKERRTGVGERGCVDCKQYLHSQLLTHPLKVIAFGNEILSNKT